MVVVRVNKGKDLATGLKLNSKGYIRVFVREGVHINPDTGEQKSTVEIAKALHFGTADMPARPFLDDAVRMQWKKIKRAVLSSLVWRFKGLTAEVQYEFAANDVANIVRQFIQEGVYYKAVAPNAPFTIQNKGSDTPLIHTGQLLEHIEGEYVALK